MTVAQGTRSIRLDSLTRVEGEGGIRIDVHDGRLEDVKLEIYEPPRLFEAFLRGRSIREAPDIVARICGICPYAHQLTAAQAIESALGITPGEEIRSLRRLFYCAEWIESHALHIYMLQAPDYFGVENVVALAAKQPEAVQRGLELKKIGNEVMTLLGGRSVHPVSVCIGGFWKTPHRAEVLAFKPKMERALELALGTARFVGALNLPELDATPECVALSHPREYGMNEGHIVSSSGLDIPIKDFEQTFLEEHVAHSTALQAVRAERGSSYLVGPLARVNLNRDRLSAAAQQADRAGACMRGESRTHRFLRRTGKAELRIFRESGRGLRRNRGPARAALSSISHQRSGHRAEREDRSADLPELSPDRRRHSGAGAAHPRPSGRGDHERVRETRAQLRSMHLLFDARSEAAHSKALRGAQLRYGSCRLCYLSVIESA